MQISHESIYRALYVQSRGELRRELSGLLRTRRSVRKSQGRVPWRGRLVGMVPIAERPPEVDDRRVPGHWEGDLLLGGRGASAIVTLVERHTRYVLLAPHAIAAPTMSSGCCGTGSSICRRICSSR